MRIAIVGLGLIGGSLALALRERRPAWERVGADADPEVQGRALRAGLIVPGDVHQADLVVLAAPIPELPALFRAFAGHPGTVTDVASTKATVLHWAHEAGLDLVGGHPMAGRERAGLENATADLFAGAPWALMRDDAKVRELTTAVGAHPLLLSPERHDELVAGVSHAAFAVSAAYVLALAERAGWPEMASLAGPGFADLSRLAGGDPRLHTAIAATNRVALLRVLDDVGRSLRQVRAAVAGDRDLGALLEQAKAARDGWARERPV
ncbi:MAG: prephenate dehydrogenase [Candidatus Dormibacteraceae bacterium]